MDYKFLKNKEQLDGLAQRRAVARPSRGAKRKSFFWVSMGLILLVGGLFYFFVFSSVFEIKRVAIEGINEVDNLNALQAAANNYTNGHKFLIVPKNNLLFLSVTEMADKLSGSAPVEELLIKKKWPNSLVVSGKEKTPVLLWREGEQNYYLDKDGRAMAAVEVKNIKYNLITMNSVATTTVAIGRSVISQEMTNFILASLQKIKLGLRGWKIARIEIEAKDSREINFYTNEGWYIIVAEGEELDKPLADLAQFLKQDDRESKKMQYVDLRIPDKIFYK